MAVYNLTMSTRSPGAFTELIIAQVTYSQRYYNVQRYKVSHLQCYFVNIHHYEVSSLFHSINYVYRYV